MTKPTRNARRERQKALFIAALRERGVVRYAVEAIKPAVTRQTVYEWRDADEQFAQEWESALEDATDCMEQEAFRRAVEGVDRVVTCGKGVVFDPDTGRPMYERHYSDTLLAKMLSANRPAKYRERTSLEVSGPDGAELNLITIIGQVAEE